MKNVFIYACALVTAVCMAACDKKNDDLVTPLSSDAFPQVIVLSDEGDGGLEDEDAFSFKITLLDRVDSSGKELGGKISPLKQPVTVSFKVTEFEGFDKLSDYIKDVKAYYEIDDCTTSEDAGINVPVTFDPSTGVGTVSFPAGVEEVEVEFEVDEDLFDDDVFNKDKRELTIQLTGATTSDSKVQVNKTASFTYAVQDDEAIYGEWELDVSNPQEFAHFKQLFGLINPEVASLNASDVKEIILEFQYEEVKAVIVLKETEQVDDCGKIKTKNKEIEIEAEIQELADDETEGDIEFGETLELDNGSFREFVYKGSFVITGKQLKLSLEGEFGDDSTDELTLTFSK